MKLLSLSATKRAHFFPPMSLYRHKLRTCRCSCWVVLASLALASGGAQAFAATAQPQTDYTRNVDPFIGVDWGGNTFVGSAIPYGMVKLGPDMETFDGRRSGFGYSSNGVILGFSHLHLSGAQGKYGNILVMPVTGPLDLSDIKSPRTDEVNRVGYYAANLTRYNVKVELTSSRRVGFHRYTFSASQQAHITINLAHALGLGTDWQAQKFLGAEVHITSNREAQGVARFTGGWNRGGEYRVYYYMVLDTPAEATQTWTGSTLSPAKDATVGANTPIGASFDFTTKANQVVQAKVGISFISAEQAKQNVQQEVPAWNFAAVRAAATSLLEQGALQAQPLRRNRCAAPPALHSDVPHHADADGSHRGEPRLEIL